MTILSQAEGIFSSPIKIRDWIYRSVWDVSASLAFGFFLGSAATSGMFAGFVAFCFVKKSALKQSCNNMLDAMAYTFNGTRIASAQEPVTKFTTTLLSSASKDQLGEINKRDVDNNNFIHEHDVARINDKMTQLEARIGALELASKNEIIDTVTKEGGGTIKKMPSSGETGIKDEVTEIPENFSYDVKTNDDVTSVTHRA